MKRKLILCIMTLSSTSLLGLTHFVLISAPGSGKGSFSQYMVKKYNYVQICPGEIFRKEIRDKTVLGKRIQPTVENGDLVDEGIVCALMAERITIAIKEEKGFILDGFPRSMHSFRFLYTFLKDKNLLSNVIFLQLVTSDDFCVHRISQRYCCTQCFKVYNVSSMRPKVVDTCDNCETILSVRKADTTEIVQKRLHYFHEHIEPLMHNAKEYFKTMIIDSTCPFDELTLKYDRLMN